MKNGIFYAVSTGAGNTELLTLQALRVLSKCDVIFYPRTKRNTIALESISELDLSKKTLVPCDFSMSGRDEYEQIVLQCKGFLQNGSDVAMISIGDVSIFSSAAKAAIALKDEGIETRFVAGVPSFCSAASAAVTELCQGDGRLSVIPADAYFENGKLASVLAEEGTKVLMKMGRHLEKIIALLDELNLVQSSVLVQNASLENERVFRSYKIVEACKKGLEDTYLSVIIIRQD